MPGPIYGIPTLDQVPAPVSNISFNSFRGTNVADPSNPQDIPSKNYVDNAISAVSGQNPGSQIISGCGVAWSGTGLVYNVSAGAYSINSTTYTLAAQQVTLSAADSSNPRIDLFVANTSSVADKITGTPSSNPVAPGFDPATQIQLPGGFALVPAGSTTPNVTNTLLYDENVGANTEWNATTSGATWNTGSTNNPNTGTKDIEATTVGTGAYVQLAKGSGTVDPSTFASLVFWIRSKAAWASNRSITISLLKDGVQYGNGVTLRDGLLGFSSSNTSGYQQIVIPLTSFNINANPINQVRFTVAGSGGSIGFYLDTINLQAAIGSNSVFNGIPTTYTTSFAVPSTTCWPITNSITLANNSSATIPGGSSVFITGTGTLPASASTTTKLSPSNFTTSSLTLVTITGLSTVLSANTLYEVDILLKFTVTTNDGQRIAVVCDGLAGSVGSTVLLSHADNGTSVTDFRQIGSESATFGGMALSTSIGTAYLKGTILTGAAPVTLRLQARRVSAGSSTFYVNSRITVTQLS